MANKRTTIMQSLKKAVRSGNISAEQAKRFMAGVGIRLSSFTKYTPTLSQRKAKRKSQKLARRANR